jgi:SpoVK/Ycf46/Vps4 family AAA+-type ATPase
MAHDRIVMNQASGTGEQHIDQNVKLKVFISYSHQDNTPENQHIEDFKRHLAPLKNNGLIEEWYDRLLLGGDDFRKIIGDNLEKADIICLFISSYFFNSTECMNEKQKALAIRKIKGIPVIPIIVSPCGWEEDSDIKGILAFPTDAKPVIKFDNRDEAWHDVYTELKKVIEKEQKIKKLTLKEDFNQFLHDAELLTNAHFRKERVLLEDIYVETELDKIDLSKKNKDKIKTDALLDNLLKDRKILIAGADQSGKTTLCKKMFLELRQLNFIPVIVSTKYTNKSGKIENMIIKSLHDQYSNFDGKVFDPTRIVPIIDDFHKSKDKENRTKSLLNYPLCLVFVDDIFGLNFKDDNIISSFIIFNIKELKPSTRTELINKWLVLNDKDVENDYKETDRNFDLIQTTLGKNLGKGLIPAYPFFILSTLVAYDAFNIPLSEEITSQGYCYQAFFTYYLMKRGIRHDDIDTYSNFLGEIALFMHQNKKGELNFNDFTVFLEGYQEKYHLSIDPNDLINNLCDIYFKNGLNNYSFKYPCFYYFFVAKALADNLDEDAVFEKISHILNNLHVDENAYIAIFLIHHSKNTRLFDEIERISLSLFREYVPVSLTKEEMRFFDDEMHKIVKAVLPPDNISTAMNREKLLKLKDDLEQSSNQISEEEQEVENEQVIADFRKTIKTVEVMGCIIRNRAGSLQKSKLREIFSDAMNAQLRLLSSLVETMKSDDEQKKFIELISKKLSQIDEERVHYKKLTEEESRKMAETFYWNINFIIVYGLIAKIIQSLGSENLIGISNFVCDKENTPATMLIKYGILIKYQKNLPLEELKKRITSDDFSELANRSLAHMIVSFCALNPGGSRMKQQIQSVLGIPKAKLSLIGRTDRNV